jgi:hypothetical protein
MCACRHRNFKQLVVRRLYRRAQLLAVRMQQMASLALRFLRSARQPARQAATAFLRVGRISLVHTWALISGETTHRLAVLVVAIIAAYFGFESLVRREYLLLFSPVGNQEVAATLEIDSTWLQAPDSYTARIDTPSGPYELGSLPNRVDVSGWPDGRYHLVISVYTRVLLFSVLSQVATVAFDIDNTPPTVQFSGPAVGEPAHGELRVKCLVEGAATYDVLIDGVVIEDSMIAGQNELPVSTTGLSDGTHDLVLVARSKAGLATYAHLPFVVDTSPPAILSLGPVVDIPLRGAVRWRPAISDASACTVEVLLDGSVKLDFQGGEVLLDAEALAEGAHTLLVCAVDSGGLRSDSAEGTICVDRTSPILKLCCCEPCSANPDRTVLLQGAALDQNAEEIDVFALEQTEQTIRITDTLDGEVTSSLEMLFEPPMDIARTVGDLFGLNAGRLYAHLLYPAVEQLPFVFRTCGNLTIMNGPVVPTRTGEVWLSPLMTQVTVDYLFWSIGHAWSGPLEGLVFGYEPHQASMAARLGLGEPPSHPVASDPIEARWALQLGHLEGEYSRNVEDPQVDGEWHHELFTDEYVWSTWARGSLLFCFFPGERYSVGMGPSLMLGSWAYRYRRAEGTWHWVYGRYSSERHYSDLLVLDSETLHWWDLVLCVDFRIQLEW